MQIIYETVIYLNGAVDPKVVAIIAVLKGIKGVARKGLKKFRLFRFVKLWF